MNNSYANYLIKKTNQDYNTIADIFSTTRSYIPEDLKNLGKYINPLELILDLGCGNGRFSEIVDSKSAVYFGVDISENIIKNARHRYPHHHFQHIDFPSALAYNDNKFDKVFCLATFHHIPSDKYRMQFLSEIYRILKPSGQLILTTWDLHSIPEAIPLLLKTNLLKIVFLTHLDKGDIIYPFKDSSGKILANRYIHNFTPKELSVLITKSKFRIINRFIQARGSKNYKNNCIIAQK